MSNPFARFQEIDDPMSLIDQLTEMVDGWSVTSTSAPSQAPVTPPAPNYKPYDAAFRPRIPYGHTQYSWTGFPATGVEQVRPDAAVRPPIVEEKEQVVEPAEKPRKRRSVRFTVEEEKTSDEKPKKAPKLSKKGRTKTTRNLMEESQSTERRDTLLEMEEKAQRLWDENKVFETKAEEGRDKFMVTFPYPYMNGVLHLGHAFTLTKAEFAGRYQRLKGKNVLFPFGFHCTGMPIAACAQRLQEEINMYGNPPQFPEEEKSPTAGKQKKGKKHKKGKVAAKKSSRKYQWDIMKSFGLNSDEEIAQFADSQTWLKYFPARGIEHLKKFGLGAAWSRSFITTAANPYYNSFIEWQFYHLRKQDKIAFGNRPAVFSAKDGQVCADHDRAQGEGAGAQEYTLIKMKLLNRPTPFTEKNGDKLQSLLESSLPVYLVAATLRPETMYGQTNCFVLPRGKYIAMKTYKKESERGDEVYICSEHAARNMAWQEFTLEAGVFETLAHIEGWDLLGRAVEAPNAQYDHVYVLPLTTIKMNKGTGIVTSVPSDAPADYVALRDAKNSEEWREKYYLNEEMVAPFEVVPIIEIPQFNSTQSAVDLCEQEGVRNQNDTVKLEDIKDRVYKYGFSSGIMLVGDFAGEKVNVAKNKVRDQLIQRNMADLYYEPESEVISRTNDICVVALTDQWYLRYGEDEWKEAVMNHVENTLETFNPTAKKQFTGVLSWLHEWACSRQFGLGTLLPWDNQWVIESLSDSTIYMAYYTVAHILQRGSLTGQGSDVPVEALTPAVWDAIFLNGPVPDDCPIPKESIDEMRKEFEYWYPMDLRVSGKDLIFNHLTFCLYNHAAIWKDDPAKWPRSFFTNGHVKVNDMKMSKSTGNFLTLIGCCEKYSADATRFALADAGDTLEDSNFSEKVANAAILRLTRFQMWVREIMEMNNMLRDGPYNEFDAMFNNAINNAIIKTDQNFADMRFRDALGSGFHVLENQRDYYRSHVEGGPHKDLINRYIEVQLLLLSPICPHFCEMMWQEIGKDGMIVNALFPQPEPVDTIVARKFEYVQETAHNFRHEFAKQDAARKKKAAKAKKPSPDTEEFNGAQVCVSTSYKEDQVKVLELLRGLYDESNRSCGEFRTVLMQEDWVKKLPKKGKQVVMGFANYVVQQELENRGPAAFDLQLPFNEYQFVVDHLPMLFHEMNMDLANVRIFTSTDADCPALLKDRTNPGNPTIKFVSVDTQAK